VKRGIFHKTSIDVCLAEMVLATPIRPTTLVFAAGEEIVVAVPKQTAGDAGEYQFLFRVHGYEGDDPDKAERLFGRRAWRHFYRLGSATTVIPFSLDDVIGMAGPRGPEIWERYHGQTQHHRIIRDVYPEDEELFRAFLQPGTEPVWAATPVANENELSPIRRRARERTRDQVIRRLLTLSRQNARTEPGRQYRPGRSQRRSTEFTELVRSLYDDTCQVCGLQLRDADGRPGRSQTHHFERWDGDFSDRMDNVICVCPNDHARFELGVLRWMDGELQEWGTAGWRSKELALDIHLATPLSLGAGGGKEASA
jgi:hypothetical protein